ncbi:carboxypeptidase regulatory-like domain-containing protein [bacterium]|nr:carboxypeptidase regulatory-like domain-containing protein [bacterium]
MGTTGRQRCKRSLYLAAAIIMLILSAVFSLSAAAPAAETEHAVPELPTVPPPAIKYVNPPAALNSQNLINAGSGWQIISFSLDRVTAVWGLERMLYRLDNNKYTIIDPVNHPEQLEQGVAYLTYLDRPTVIYFLGANISASKTSVLKNGWNLFCCPGNLNSVSLNALTLSNSSGQTVAAADLKQRPSQPVISWIDAESAYILQNGHWKEADLASSVSLNKGEILALYANEPLSLNWNNAASNTLPQITVLDPQIQTIGQNVIVKGKNLGEAADSSLSLAGAPVTAANIVEWHDNYIKFKVPQGCNSGSVRIYRNGRSSNALTLAVKDQKSQSAAKEQPKVKSAHSSKTFQPTVPAQPVASAKAPAAAAPQPAPSAKAQPKQPAPAKAPAAAAPQPAPSAKAQPKQPVPAKAPAAQKAAAADLDMLGDIDSSSKSSQSRAQKLAQTPASVSAADLEDIKFEQKQIASASKPSYKEQHQQITGRLQQTQTPQGLLPVSRTGGGASLSGLVTDSSGKPLDHARVVLEGGPNTYTDSNGNFYLGGLTGETTEKIMITKYGYNTGRGTVSLVSGETKKLKVSLSPSSSSKNKGADKPKTGSFTVHANTMRVGPRDRRVYVYKIEVSEDGNASRHWQNTWWNDDGDVYKELICDGAEIGKLYNITVTWKGKGRRNIERSDKWTKRFTSDDQKFSFDHP